MRQVPCITSSAGHARRTIYRDNMDRNRFVERLGKPGVASLRSGGQFATEQLVTIKRNGWSVSSGTAGQFERNTHSKDKDPEKGLSNAGKEDTRRIADVAKNVNFNETINFSNC